MLQANNASVDNVPRYERRIVGPQEARELLATQPPLWNRNIRQSHVAKLAKLMVSGKWDERSPAPLVIAADGTLIDGQHRLLAVITADRPISFALAIGCSRDARLHIDGGLARTPSDMLRMLGFHHCALLAATARWLYCYREMVWRDRTQLPDSREAPREDIVDIAVEQAEHIYKALGILGFSHEMTMVLNQPIVAFVHVLGNLTSPDRADLFLESLRDGTDLAEYNPAHLLRKQFIGNRGRVTRKFDRVRMSAVSVKAWLSFEEDEALGILRWRSNEGFPRFRCTWPYTPS